jgi:hypothetical protein
MPWTVRSTGAERPKKGPKFGIGNIGNFYRLKLLRNFGLKVGVVGAAKFEQRIHEFVEGLPDLSKIMEVLLEARRKLREQLPP